MHTRELENVTRGPSANPTDLTAAVAARRCGKRWSELSDRQQTVLLVLASVQLSLAATAWADLATRPASLVNGRKDLWAAVIGVTFIGPIAYFTWGCRART